MASTQEQETAQTGCVNINVTKNIDKSDKSSKKSKKKQTQALFECYSILNVDEIKLKTKEIVEDLGGKVPGLNRANRELLIYLLEHCISVKRQKALKALKASEKKLEQGSVKRSPPKKRKRSEKQDEAVVATPTEESVVETKDQ